MTDEQHSNCSCGENHDEVIQEAMPEMMVLRAADELVNESDWDISKGMGVSIAALSDEHMDRLIQFARMEGLNAREAVHNLAAAMLARGIFMGCALRDFYGDKFGTVEIPTPDEVEEAIKQHEMKRAASAEKISKLSVDDLPEGLRKQLEEAGLDLSQVGVMMMEIPRDESGRFQQPESASDEPKLPGFYL